MHVLNKWRRQWRQQRVPCTCCRNMTLFGGNVMTMLIAAAVPPQKNSRTCGKRAKMWVCCGGNSGCCVSEVALGRSSAPRSLTKLSILRLSVKETKRLRMGFVSYWGTDKSVRCTTSYNPCSSSVFGLSLIWDDVFFAGFSSADVRSISSWVRLL